MKLIKRLNDKFSWAFSGLKHAISEDTSVITQILLAVIAISLSFYLKLEKIDFIIIIIMCGLVISVELLNSSIEELSDYKCGNEYSSKIKIVKDLSASAVLVISITALIVGIMIFKSYIF